MARAALGLVRSGLPEKTYRFERGCYRDAGRKLAAVRDARVLVDTLDSLRSSSRDQVEEAVFGNLRRVLRSDVVRAQRALRRRAVRDDVAAALEALVALACQRSRTLRRRAERLAEYVYAESPGDYVARVGVYFRQWRAERPPARARP